MIVDAVQRIATEANIDVENTCSPEACLIEQARKDGAAFAKLYRMHYDAVFRYCAHRLFDRHAAEDITSAVFSKVVERFHGFKGDDRQFRNWLYTIATNEVNNFLRCKARGLELLKLYSQRATKDKEPATSVEKLAALQRGLLALKPKYQTIITLRFFEKMKLTEIAEVTGARPATVRSQLARALAKLKKTLAFAGPQREVQND